MFGPLIPRTVVEPRVVAQVSRNQVQRGRLLADETICHYAIPRLHPGIADLRLQFFHRLQLAGLLIQQRIVMHVARALDVLRQAPAPTRHAQFCRCKLWDRAHPKSALRPDAGWPSRNPDPRSRRSAGKASSFHVARLPSSMAAFLPSPIASSVIMTRAVGVSQSLSRETTTRDSLPTPSLENTSASLSIGGIEGQETGRKLNPTSSTRSTRSSRWRTSAAKSRARSTRHRPASSSPRT